jgi:hypothetical protein
MNEIKEKFKNLENCSYSNLALKARENGKKKLAADLMGKCFLFNNKLKFNFQ